MRIGWRKFVVAVGLLLLMEPAQAAPGDSPAGGAAPVMRLTIEVGWMVAVGAEGQSGDVPAAPGEVELEVSEGRVVGAVAWPSGVEPEARGDRAWRLGTTDRAGRVRARIEVGAGASLIVRAAGQSMRIPIGSLLDGPQRTPFQTPVEIVVDDADEPIELHQRVLERRRGEQDFGCVG